MPEPEPPPGSREHAALPGAAVVNVDQLFAAWSALAKQQPAAPPPSPDLPGQIGAWAKFFAGLTLDKILAFALIVGFGFVLYQGPIIYADVTAQNSRVQQDEQERTRQLFIEMNDRNNKANGEHTKMVIQAFSLNSKETGRLATTVERLEGAVNRLNTKVGGPPPPPPQNGPQSFPDDPCSVPWWDRMLDGTELHPHLPVRRGRAGVPVPNDDDPAGEHGRPVVVRRGGAAGGEHDGRGAPRDRADEQARAAGRGVPAGRE